MRVCLIVLAGVLTVVGASSAASGTLDEILRETGVQITGGLVVHVGCDGPGDVALTAGLHLNDSFLVHGLSRNPESVAAARKRIHSLGLYGQVSVALWDGRALPYGDNLVNLIVIGNGEQVAESEILRTLAPMGIAITRRDGQWDKIVKPRPEEIDEWTHYMHDPGNNAVAHDSVIGPPRRLQWLGGPRWSRHHDHVASMNAMVSAKGRLFYIFDEGATASALTPSDWKLVSRDAFNGVILWKSDIPDWIPALWPLKAGPANLPRRLVAVDDSVYVPLGFEAPVSALDAASGKILREYAGSEMNEEILVEGDLLLVLTLLKAIITDPSPGKLMEAKSAKAHDRRMSSSPLIQFYWQTIQSRHWFDSSRTIRAYRASTGERLWKVSSTVMPLSLAVDKQRVYYHDGERIVALNRDNGEQVFATEAVGVTKTRMMSFFAPTLVVHDNVIVFAGGEKIGFAWMGWESDDQGKDSMTAFSASTGEKLWSAPHPYGGYQSPEDVLIADGLVWAADTANSKHEGAWIGRDLNTGEVKKEIPPTVASQWFHHRCYRAKATDKFMLPSRNGIEFIDIEAKTWGVNNWVRSGCLYGVMPANGFIYNSPHNCACHPQAKLSGFNALAADIPNPPAPVRNEDRLVKGPAYGRIAANQDPKPSDWPMYRADTRRSGFTSSQLGHKLGTAWTAELGGKLTQPVVVSDLLVVADINGQTVHALDARTGKERWLHIAGGRVDSSPTIYAGRVFFGSTDGTVTCLRASDGELVWRFLAAPLDRRLVSFGQVESIWPVNGSVLVKDGEVYFTAGRSFFLDGGVRFYRLDAETGKVLAENLFDNRDYLEDGELDARGGKLDMPVGLPDILSADGDVLYMRSQLMDKNGERTSDLGHHLFAPFGFVDDSWFHRSYWVYGQKYMGGHSGYSKAGKIHPAGRMVVFDDEDVYVYGREQSYYRWITEMEYELFRSPRVDSGGKVQVVEVEGKSKGKGKGNPKRASASKVKVAQDWAVKTPILVRAMAKAGDTLFIAGPPDLINEDETLQMMHVPDVATVLAEQNAAYLGEKGAVLQAVSAETGKTLAEYKLAGLPTFDGMSIAGGRLYIASETGRLLCMEPAK